MEEAENIDISLDAIVDPTFNILQPNEIKNDIAEFESNIHSVYVEHVTVEDPTIQSLELMKSEVLDLQCDDIYTNDESLKSEELDIKNDINESFVDHPDLCNSMLESRQTVQQQFYGFSKRSYEQQLQIKQQGRPLPNMVIEFKGSSRGKQYVRKFNREIYARNKWICGCSIKNSFFCFPCILFGGDAKWTSAGIRDLVHLSDRIKTHENSKQHILNQMHLALLGTANIQAQLDSAYWLNIQKHNDQVTKNRYVLSKIIDCIKFCGAFELVLRGHDESVTSENLGIFQGLINFTAELDNTVQQHLQSATVFKGTSKEIQNDLLDCILDVYHEEITKEINAASYIAVMADETTDVSAKFQMALILRYVKGGSPIERFWGFLVPSGHNAQALTDTILSVIEPLVGSDHGKLVAQSYDGGTVMSGKQDGIQAKIKERYPNAHFVHCYAHQLAFIIAQASSQNTQVRLFFSNIQDIPAFFSNSPQRIDLLDKIIGRKNLRSVPTQSNFECRTVNVVFEYREEIIECMEDIENGEEGTKTTLNQAMAIKRMLQDKKFVFWLTFFRHVMPHVDILINALQKSKTDSVEVNQAVQKFEENINDIKQNKIDEILKEADGSVNEIETAKRKRTQEKFENNRAAVLEICNVIINVVKERFQFSEHLVAASLFLPEKFSGYINNFPEAELNATVNSYPTLLKKQRLRTELSIIYTRNEYRSIGGATSLLKFLISNSLDDAFKEIKKLLEILITIPMRTAEANPSFSTLKRIKTFLRNTMTQERLSALAVLSIESKFIRTIPNFNDKVIDKFANKKNPRIDLICKK